MLGIICYRVGAVDYQYVILPYTDNIHIIPNVVYDILYVSAVSEFMAPMAND